jgi:ABC-type dipeptide/oligopeptide/nickel transport system permease component
MGGYVLRRLAYLVPVWLGISLLAYGLANIAPGDPAEIILRRQTGEQPSVQAVQALRQQLGLDDAFPVRYARWVGHAAMGDLGTSYRTNEPVLAALAQRFGMTLQIALAALAIAIGMALPIGTLSAVQRNRPLDHVSRLVALIIVFALMLKALPVAGSGGPQYLVLPALTLGLGTAAALTRLTRASLLEVLEEDYMRTARAKGLPGRAAVLRHALRNALIPIVTLIGIRFGQLLGGAVIVETVFAWPGIGTYVISAIYDRDYPTIQGFVLFMGTVFVTINLLVDVAYVWLDPRVRIGTRRGAG